MAKSELSHESRDKIRDVLASIPSSGVKFGYLVKNPVEGLRLPPDKSGRSQKPYIRPAVYSALLELIPEPYRTMVFVASYTRVGVRELIAAVSFHFIPINQSAGETPQWNESVLRDAQSRALQKPRSWYLAHAIPVRLESPCSSSLPWRVYLIVTGLELGCRPGIDAFQMNRNANHFLHEVSRARREHARPDHGLQ